MKARNAEELADVIHTLYAAGEGTLPWSHTLNRIGEAVDGRDTSLILVDWDRGGEPLVCESVRGAPETVEAYNRHWRERDAWVLSGHPLMRTDNVVFASQEVLSDDEVRRTPFYEHFLQPAGLSQMLAFHALMRPGVMGAVQSSPLSWFHARAASLVRSSERGGTVI